MGQNQGVARLHEVEQRLQLGSPLIAAIAGLLGTDKNVASRLSVGPKTS